MQPDIAGKAAAVVVTFHPEDGVFASLQLIRDQVDLLIVVDNGSNEVITGRLRSASADGRFTLVENGANLGVATALNLGVIQARNCGAEWIFFFDQDSRVTENFVSAMLLAAHSSSWGDRLGILAPAYSDLRSGRLLPAPPRTPEGGFIEAITSGSLMQLRTLAALGPFADELFVDGVDHEMSLRVRRAGLVIEQCPSALLLHSPGTPIAHSFLGRSFHSTNYSPLRRYYQERSKIWIAKRYLKAFPGFCLALLLGTFKDAVKIICLEDQKLNKLRMGLRGLRDGLLNHMGPYQP